MLCMKLPSASLNTTNKNYNQEKKFINEVGPEKKKQKNLNTE